MIHDVYSLLQTSYNSDGSSKLGSSC